MKTLRMIGIALFAVLMCVNFASCSSEEIAEKLEPQKYTISLACVGEILDISQGPMTRTTTKTTANIYKVRIISGNKVYAHGSFASMDNLTVDLLNGNIYNIDVTYILNSSETPTNIISYDQYDFIDGPLAVKYQTYETSDVYYGIQEEYTPTANGIVSIHMKRMVFGFNIKTNDLVDGATLDIYLVPSGSVSSKICTLTNNEAYDAIYSFPDWQYSKVYKGVSSGDTYVNYYENADLKIILKRVDGVQQTLAEETIIVERNKKTYATINVGKKDDALSSGITITIDDEDMSDGTQYDIDGEEGTITKTEIESN